MRKWRILSALLAVLLAAELGISAAQLQAEGANVTFTRTLLAGEEAEFAGVAVTERARLGGGLHWDARCLLDTGKTETRCRFGAVPYEQMEYDSTLSVWLGLLTEQENLSLQYAAEPLAASAPEGADSVEGTLRACEVFGRLPLHAQISDPYGIPADKDEVFRAFFDMPIPDDWTIPVSVIFVNPNDHAQGYYLEGVELNAAIGWPETNCRSVQVGDDFYFTLDLGAAAESAVYRYHPQTEQIETVYSFPAHARVLAFWQTETLLCMLHTQTDDTVITTLSLPDMAVRQNTPLQLEVGTVFYEPIRQGGTFLLPDTQGRVLALTQSADGVITPETIAVPADDPALAGYDDKQTSLRDYLQWNTYYAAGGGRLVIAAPAESDDDAPVLDVLLSVYDAQGRRSSMRLESSLSREIVADYRTGARPDVRALYGMDPMLVPEVGA